MRIHLLSDIHLEWGRMANSYTPPEDIDVVILAGDIGGGVQGVHWACETFDCPVLMVAGNHEHYGYQYDDNLADLRLAAAGTNVTFMENDTVEIDGVRFFGATMWTDFDLYCNAFSDRLTAERGINDYRLIRAPGGTKLTGLDTLGYHYESRRTLEAFLEDKDGKPKVVITHHAPSEMSCEPQYKGDRLTPSFASRLEKFMLDHDPVLWVHGHMHNNADYMIGDTRVVANPRGYVGHHLNKHFTPDLVIEI